MKAFFLILILSSFGNSSFAAEDLKDESMILCKNHHTVRTIRVNSSDEGGCTTVYTKEGVDRVVGSGSYKQSCLTFLENIKTNLEQAAWKCRSVANSKVTNIQDL